jgi:acetyl-CoA C-acetyltransferase
MSVYILSGSRTPIGSLLGDLSTVPAPKLGAISMQNALEKAKVDGKDVDEVYMGNVIQAGVGQAPARQATIFANLPSGVPATTVNKVCGSGLMSIVLGARAIQTEEASLVVAGGMENMSLAPHILPQSRVGQKYGALLTRDSMEWDGLWDVYSNRSMGNCAEECAQKYQFTREQQDQYAIASFKKAQKASQEGIFKNEICAVTIQEGKTSRVVDTDESPFKAKFDKIPLLRPSFLSNGTITAANASTLNDGAAAVVLGGEKYKQQARFKIIASAAHAADPTWFTTAPVQSMQKCLKKAGLNVKDIDLFEINEAFSVVALAAIKELSIAEDKINIYGGAIALGHPIGASGARIIVTLMNAMTMQKKKRGMASLCIGGGEALSLIIEQLM